MSAQTVVDFHEYEQSLRGLVAGYLEEERQGKSPGQRLLLAAWYAHPIRDFGDVFILEVWLKFGTPEPDPDRQFFEVAFRYADGFDLAKGQSLRIVFANVLDFEHGFKEGWEPATEILAAKKNGAFEILYQADDLLLPEALR